MDKQNIRNISIKWKLYFPIIIILVISLIAISALSIVQNKRFLTQSIHQISKLDMENTSLVETEINNVISYNINEYITTIVTQSLIILLLASILIYKLCQYYSYILKNLGSIGKKIAAGRVGMILEYNRKDEVGEVLNAFSTIIKSKKKLSEKIDTVTDDILRGNISSRIDESNVSGYSANFTENINKMVDYFMEMLDNVESNIIILDNNFNIKYLNKYAIKLTGKHLDAILQKNFYNVFKMEDSTESYSPLKVVFYTGSTASSKTQLHINNMDMEVQYSAIPVKNEKNEVMSVLCFITDTTLNKTDKSVYNKRLDYEKEKIERLISNLGQNFDYEMDQENIWSDIEDKINRFETARF